ncbi:oligoribonuclease [Leptinotarsa decemlineata]|uniref:oligoribonuclease n=1 Tax=Leptinotarsa decemlineata TaxID=7539 RepID=UPI003D304115
MKYEFSKSMVKIFIAPLLRTVNNARTSFKKYNYVDKLTSFMAESVKSPAMANSLNLNTLAASKGTEVNRIVWIDMEMTGLDLDRDKIMEVASLITDSHLNIIAEGPEIVIHQPEDVLNNMNEWCLKQHGKTGLTESCLKSTTTLEQAEKLVLQFLTQHVNEKISPLAGNSVYMDRMFLMKYMPRVHDYLHYRIIDVSAVKEMCRRWNPKLYSLVPKKEYSHRALMDIRESVEELKFYKDNFFKIN